jgi:hypothetical protein
VSPFHKYRKENRKKSGCQAPVAHTCNPSYSGGRDQEDRYSKPAWAKSLRDSISKKLFIKKDWWSDSRCRPQHGKKKKKEKAKRKSQRSLQCQQEAEQGL